MKNEVDWFIESKGLEEGNCQCLQVHNASGEKRSYYQKVQSQVGFEPKVR